MASHNDANPAESLGDPIRVFRADMLVRVVLALAGLVMSAGAFYLIARDFSEGVYIYSFGWMLLPVGLVALFIAYFMGRSSYHICPHGVIRVRFGRQQQIRWDEINEVVDAHIKQGMVSSRVCTLVKKNGSHMELADLGISDFPALLDLIRQQTNSRNIPWKEQQIVK